MKRSLTLLAAMLLTACKPGHRPMPTVEELIAQPERLQKLQRRCKLDRDSMGDALCARVGEATTRRFLGEGRPRPPDPYKAAPQP
ncbi:MULTISPECIES: EexN family lipoprotein [Xanthomonas]|uniref:EexN family lipoprotein n=1 Tax=Xanthomonas TaxID=338 RepID=UPI0004776CDA|nr:MULTISPECIES: EexN family lipoprotein [Xanthomonas]